MTDDSGKPQTSSQPYEPPALQDIPAEDGPAVTAAGDSPNQVLLLARPQKG
jgi:hypothetical protein